MSAFKISNWLPKWLPKWLPQALFEATMILFGFLLYFTVEGWQEDKKTEHLIAYSINHFENEIKRNNLRIKDVMVFHKGIQQVLQNANFNSIAEFRNIMDAMKPIVLSNSAWETAVATGALAHMDFELVSALTLTYNMQTRFDENYRATVRTLLLPNSLTEQNLELALYATTYFVTEVTAQEAELAIFYNQMLIMLRSRLSLIGT